MSSDFRAYLRRLVRKGRLEVVCADGVTETFGDGEGPLLGVKVVDRRGGVATDGQSGAVARRTLYGWTIVRHARRPLQRCWTSARGTSLDLRGLPWVQALHETRVAFRGLHQRNDRRRARRNIASHYDLDARLYDLFLDSDRQYSCAYFEYPGQSLDDAQTAKKRHIAAKLLPKDGATALDIGCGFGGMGLYLAGVAGAKVTGVTLSERAIRRRDRSRPPARGWPTGSNSGFRTIATLSRHSTASFRSACSNTSASTVTTNSSPPPAVCSRTTGSCCSIRSAAITFPGATNPWIRKYIFPGGHIPSLSEVLPAVERAGLFVTDIEILRLHYAETLRAWRERFMARRDEAAKLYDERFCRMWEFYLAGSETSFRVDGNMVFQLQLAKRQEGVPLTRDYIAEREAELRRREAARPSVRHAAE